MLQAEFIGREQELQHDGSYASHRPMFDPQDPNNYKPCVVVLAEKKFRVDWLVYNNGLTKNFALFEDELSLMDAICQFQVHIKYVKDKALTYEQASQVLEPRLPRF